MTSKPRILILDIETMSNVAFVWGKWEQNVIDFKKEWYIIGFSAKWLGGEHSTKVLPDYPRYKRNREDDVSIVKELWKLLDQADCVIAHNGDQFDIKKINARFSFHNIPPPSPYRTIDTLKLAKKYYSFNSNSLNDLGKHLHLGEKVENGGFKLWRACLEGDPKAWEKMRKYNHQDVVLLEKVYKRFLPWIAQHLNYNLYSEKPVCGKCGKQAIRFKGIAVTRTGKLQRIQCQACGGWGQISLKGKVQNL